MLGGGALFVPVSFEAAAERFASGLSVGAVVSSSLSPISLRLISSSVSMALWRSLKMLPCQANGVPVWCGGMLEGGIGRARNIALSTLPNFVLPGDVSASKRYWARDIITPAIEVTSRGIIGVSNEPGFGYEIETDYLESLVVRRQELT